MALTFAQSVALLGLGVKVLDQQKKFFDTNTPNVRAMVAAVITALDGEFAAAQTSQVEAKLNAMRSGLESGQVQQFFKPFLDDICYTIDAPRNGWNEQLRSLRDYMIANSKTIEERTMSYGSFSAGGGNVGNGTLYALSVDKNNVQLQSARADSLAFTVMQDASSGLGEASSGGSKNREQFRGLGGFAYGESRLDQLFLASYDANNKLSNPRFSSYSGPTVAVSAPVAPNAVSNFASWVLSGTTGVFKTNRDFVTRGGAGATAANGKMTGLTFDSDGNFYQLLGEAGKVFDPEIPYLPAVLVYKPTGVTGNVTIAWGSKSQTFALSGLTNNAWSWCIADRDQDLFYDRWRQNDTRFTVTADTLSADIHIQECGLYEPTAMNGIFYWALGKDTPFVRGDTFAQTVSQSADGLIQRWLMAEAVTVTGIVLPHAGSPTEPDPS